MSGDFDKITTNDISINLKEEKVNTQEYSNMSEKEIEAWRNFLLFRDGYRCKRCNKTVDELIKEDQLRRQRAKKEEPRIMPVLTIGHRNGDSRVTSLPGTQPGSNLELQCYSCNQLSKQVQSELPQVQSHDVSGSLLVNRKKMPKYLNHINEHINKFGHYCEGEALSSGCKAVGLKSQITAERYIFIERGANGLFDLHEFDCDSQVCTGKHIFRKGQKPINLTDEQFVEMREKDRTFLQIHENENPDYILNKVLDAEVIRCGLPFPISTEFDVFRKLKLGNSVEKYFAMLESEKKYYHRLGFYGKAMSEYTGS